MLVVSNRFTGGSLSFCRLFLTYLGVLIMAENGFQMDYFIVKSIFLPLLKSTLRVSLVINEFLLTFVQQRRKNLSGQHRMPFICSKMTGLI